MLRRQAGNHLICRHIAADRLVGRQQFVYVQRLGGVMSIKSEKKIDVLACAM